MHKRLCVGWARSCSSVALVLSLLDASPVAAQEHPGVPDALLAIDRQRASVVERIVAAWGAELAKANDAISIDELRMRLLSLRADRLFAASLAGSAQALREAAGLSTASHVKPVLQTKALGDLSTDVVYTPVTPCRLVETRGVFAAVYQGNGTASHTPVPFASNEIRTYTVQGGNGVCVTQLPAGLAPSAVQLQVFGMPTTNVSGDIEILPQGASFGSTATMVYVNTLQFNTVSTAAKINAANKQISVQVRGGGAHVAIDVVGYFAAPSGTGGRFFRQGGNAFGTTASVGTIDNQALSMLVDNMPAMTWFPHANSPNIVGGHPGNAINSSLDGQTIAGGGIAGTCSEPTGGTRPCTNMTSAAFATIAGGFNNRATGASSTVSGGSGNSATESGATVSGGDFNRASSLYTTVSGGNDNTAGAGYATVAGGLANTASGPAATVIGGNSNTASGASSVAAGHNANAVHSNSYVWNGWSFGSATSFNPNAFQIHAENGLDVEYGIRRADGGGTSWVFIGSNASFPDQAIATSTGAYLGTDGMWHDKSDRDRKTEIVPVDPRDVLARVTTLPIATWRYRDEPSGRRHLGPMAQDFFASFRLGVDDTTIGTIDESGVALAAIQGLRELLREKDLQLAAQHDEIERLRDRLAALEAIRDEVAALRASINGEPGIESSQAGRMGSAFDDDRTRTP